MEDDSMKLDIAVFSPKEHETAALAAELKQVLTDGSKVELTSRQRPDTVPTRGLDPGTVFQVINIVLATAQTIISLASHLKDKAKKSTGSDFIITNPDTGKKTRLHKTDSLEQIQEKLQKLLGPKPPR